MNDKLVAKLSLARDLLEKAQVALAEATFLTEESAYGREVDSLHDKVADAYNEAAYFAGRIGK